MFRYVVLFALIGCAFGVYLPDEWAGRIVGGEDTTINEHPYQVSIQTLSGSHFCGGSIINEDTIVTAAHCMQSYKPSQMQIRLGATNYKTGGQVVGVRAVKYHEGYNSKTMVNDVAIMKLSSPVAQNGGTIRYIPLATKTPATGDDAVVSGWGTTCYLWCNTLPTTLQKVSVTMVQESDCGSSQYKYGSQIHPTMVCATGVNKDACQGDSGGPLVSGGKLVGVVSWGIGCARDGYPGVYADVASLYEWVNKNSATL